jgi:hypothetical protein
MYFYKNKSIRLCMLFSNILSRIKLKRTALAMISAHIDEIIPVVFLFNLM